MMIYSSANSRNVLVAVFPFLNWPPSEHQGALARVWVGGRREAHGGANAAPEPNACAQVLFGSGIQRLTAGATLLFSAPRPCPGRFSCLEFANHANGPHIAQGWGCTAWQTTALPVLPPPLEWLPFPPLVAAVLITPKGDESPGSSRIGVIGALGFFFHLRPFRIKSTLPGRPSSALRH